MSSVEGATPQAHGALALVKVPKHVAIIMDGNGRWAKQRGWNRSAGHIKGTTRVKEIIREADRLGIGFLTLYAFSTENWGRPAEEISVLMELLRDYLVSERQDLMDNQVRLQALGQVDRIPPEVREILEETIEATKNNRGLTLSFCISYGGRQEILQATQRLLQEALEKKISPSDLNESMLTSKFYTQGMPDPDLLIRTSGEYRISNFLLWQAAYAELYITETLWPDFEPQHLRAACEAYAQRKRRFGLSDESHQQRTS
jgi:undecaprenyl diphosphate synthase